VIFGIDPKEFATRLEGYLDQASPNGGAHISVDRDDYNIAVARCLASYETEPEGPVLFYGIDPGDVRLYDLALPTRTLNALHREDIRSLHGLLYAGRERVGTWRGIGKWSLEEIDATLKAGGIDRW
jgi:DNA-directed RNA polymerase alpha subunit